MKNFEHFTLIIGIAAVVLELVKKIKESLSSNKHHD